MAQQQPQRLFTRKSLERQQQQQKQLNRELKLPPKTKPATVADKLANTSNRKRKDLPIHWWIACFDPATQTLSPPERWIAEHEKDPAQFAPANRLMFPWVYIPIQYSDPAWEETRGLGLAQLKVALINQQLNWNMTAKQRIKAIRKHGGVILEGAFGYSSETSPLLVEPPVRDRRSLRSRRHTKAPMQTTLMNVVRRETQREKGYAPTVDFETGDALPHEPVKLRLKPVDTPINHIPGHASWCTEQEFRELFEIPEDNAPHYDRNGKPIFHY